MPIPESVLKVPEDDGVGVVLARSQTLELPGESRSFRLTEVPDGPHDLAAARFAVARFAVATGDDLSITPRKLIVRRAVDPTDGSTMADLDHRPGRGERRGVQRVRDRLHRIEAAATWPGASMPRARPVSWPADGAALRTVRFNGTITP
jgi:hypothetical protein